MGCDLSLDIPDICFFESRTKPCLQILLRQFYKCQGKPDSAYTGSAGSGIGKSLIILFDAAHSLIERVAVFH